MVGYRTTTVPLPLVGCVLPSDAAGYLRLLLPVLGLPASSTLRSVPVRAAVCSDLPGSPQARFSLRSRGYYCAAVGAFFKPFPTSPGYLYA